MRPSQVLDLQADLLTRLTSDDVFRAVQGTTIHAEFVGQAPLTDRERAAREAEADDVANGLLDQMAVHVRAAYTYRVSPEMTDLMIAAAAGLDGDDTWNPNLAPSGCGFVRFEKPVPLAWATGDDDAPPLLADWLIWGPAPEGRTALWFLADTARPDEIWTARIASWGYDEDVVRRMHGRWALVAWDGFKPGMKLGPNALPLPGRALHEDEVQALQNTPWDTAHSTAVATLTDALTQSNDGRYAHALWLLLEQTVVTRQEEPIERPSRRRAERLKIRPRVTTVLLRRAKHPDSGDHADVAWQFSWLVRGHWRWQACGPHHPLAQEVTQGRYRARIWISPHIKGPEDKPLKPTSEKVFDLRR